MYYILKWASQVALVVKNVPASAGDIRDTGSVPGSGRSPGGGIPWSGQTTSIFMHRESHGWSSLVGYSPVQFSCSAVSDSLWPHGLQHAGFPVLHQPLELAQTHVHWVGDAIQLSSSVVSFSSHLQSFPASGSFPRSQFFASGGQSIGASASASVLLMNIQDWCPLWLTALISMQSKRLSRVFS